ncbi:hypothetical protein [Streptococcus gallolyticus]|uniref:hypothetical protein n=1 Tax=Streptococcus gallolyticus TaxID=315405 RepID=UPI0002E40117|nr:hypothetical protein [Streptococcus gallolyticus]QBX15916.1 hypothetical protein Javan227_0006 [Streptococcus phage Javan227]QKI01107.1 hypothetical protein FOC63_06125 [Streptococcus gallolyticus]QWX87178.1 hypothetical protein JGX27_02215 [Streptococcus gallolyticus subsp. gallolyticus TX20005]
MTAELISIISIMSNVAIIGINEYSKYKTALKAKELEHQLTVEHSKQQRAVEDFQNFLRAAGKVTAIVEKRIETDISEIFDFDSATFAVLVHLKEHERTTFLDFRNSLKINLSYPDADDTYLDDLINDMNKQSSELDKKLKSHRNRYYSLLNNCVEIAYDYINV